MTEPTEMELRVARAIYDSGYSGMTDFGSLDEMLPVAIIVARAAIRAMREPTQGMWLAAADETYVSMDAWRAMIDAASPLHD